MNYREKAKSEIRETKLEETLHCSTGNFLWEARYLHVILTAPVIKAQLRSRAIEDFSMHWDWYLLIKLLYNCNIDFIYSVVEGGFRMAFEESPFTCISNYTTKAGMHACTTQDLTCSNANTIIYLFFINSSRNVCQMKIMTYSNLQMVIQLGS